MKYYRVPDGDIQKMLKDLSVSNYMSMGTGDIVVFKDGSTYEVIRIAERRLYDENLKMYYQSDNDNYKRTDVDANPT